MAEPKKRLTSTRSGGRQSHDALSAGALFSCSNCKQKIKPHTMCSNCGFYRGKKVTEIKEEKEQRSKEQEEFKNEQALRQNSSYAGDV